MPTRLTLILLGGSFGAFAAAPTTYEEWQAMVFSESQIADPAISSETGNPDGDHSNNWQEYAFGTDPLVFDETHGLIVSPRGSHTELTHSFRPGATDLFYLVEGTPDLSKPWSLRNYMDWLAMDPHPTEGMALLTRQDFAADQEYPDYFWRVRVVRPDSPDALRFDPPLEVRATPLAGRIRGGDGLWAFSHVRLDWIDRSAVEWFCEVRRRTLPDGDWGPPMGAPADVTVFRDTAVEGSTQYEYGIRLFSSRVDPPPPEVYVITPPTPADTDRDGIPDVLELGSAYNGADSTFPTSATDATSGIHEAPDGWWLARGLDPFSTMETDTDGDGRPDWVEYLHATDPLAADEKFNGSLQPPEGLALDEAADGAAVLTWNTGGTGRWILVERSPDAKAWTLIAALPSSARTFTDRTRTPGSVFLYRLVTLD
jgi:hypothetical protein